MKSHRAEIEELGRNRPPNMAERLLSIALDQDAMIRNLRLELLAAGQGLKVVPHLRFDYEGYHRLAVNLLGITDPEEAGKYVETKFSELVDYLNTLRPDDVVVSALPVGESEEEPS